MIAQVGLRDFGVDAVWLGAGVFAWSGLRREPAKIDAIRRAFRSMNTRKVKPSRRRDAPNRKKATEGNRFPSVVGLVP